MDLFWPAADPESARRSLHQTIYVIRKTLRTQPYSAQYVMYENDCYSINPDVGMWCDVDEFEASITAGRCAEREERLSEAVDVYDRAVTLYQGDYLEDQPYEEWAVLERERLRLLYLDGSNRLADLRLARGEVDVALALTEGVLRREPCDEVAHRRALRCHAAVGNRAQVVRQYRAYTEVMRDILGLHPSQETAALYNSLVTS